MNILKQSTQIVVRVGPFVDATDAVTPETGITLGAADQAEALKAAGAATVDISAATWAAITGADGWYNLTLTTSHTDTVGELAIVVQDSSVCLPVFVRFQVIEEAVYDALYAASAAGPLQSTVAGRTLDVSAGGEAGVDWANVGSPTTTVGLSGTTVKTATDVETDTADIQTKIGTPAGASVSADVAAVKVDTAAILVDTGTDGVVVAAGSKTGYSLTATTGLGNQTANITGNLSGSVGSVTGAVGSVTANVNADVKKINAVTIVGDGSATPFNV